MQIGGSRAPTPVGDLGFVEMTQAVPLFEARWQVVGPDMLCSGYLPSSGGLHALAAVAAAAVEGAAAAGQEADGAAPAEGRMRNLPPADLLAQLPPLQKLLERLMDAMPRGAAARHYVVQAALLTVAKESFQVRSAASLLA